MSRFLKRSTRALLLIGSVATIVATNSAPVFGQRAPFVGWKTITWSGAAFRVVTYSTAGSNGWGSVCIFFGANPKTQYVSVEGPAPWLPGQSIDSICRDKAKNAYVDQNGQVR